MKKNSVVAFERETRKQDGKSVSRATFREFIVKDANENSPYTANDVFTVGGKVVSVSCVDKRLLQNEAQESRGGEAHATKSFPTTEFLRWKRNLNGLDVTANNHRYRVFNFENCAISSHRLSRLIICENIGSVFEEVKYT